MPLCRVSESAGRRRVTVCIGMTQLINWGTAFYLPGVFCAAIAADRGWSPTLAFSGATLALMVMGCLSPYAGRLLDRAGGRRVMMLGGGGSAAGCMLMAASTGMTDYFMAWVMLGVGMRLSLYEAAFATLVALYGGEARRAISLVTLFGGISSSLFWPLGMALLNGLGWRWGVAIYGVIVLSGLLWLWALPQPASQLAHRTGEQTQTSLTADARTLLPAVLYAVLMALFSFLSAGISAHLLAILTGFGVSASLGALWGVGQVCARVGDVLMGGRLPALKLSLFLGAGLPVCFLLALLGEQSLIAAVLFVAGYGAANGLSTLVKAALPLELFGRAGYSSRIGLLLTPGFFFSAAAPSVYAALRASIGDRGVLMFSFGVACLITLTAVLLYLTRQRAARSVLLSDE
ncbi:MFS transporter [Dickeya fangzhongdai]|uniref:MFS transporter n=1 Tax=Dickeya fangzhongdai TaxID=1778540 RepID=UPI001ADB81CB|nr:MFS transporter [Dickeya fangzhongdai]MBO8132635.1 MFS transporter [Dickeya fangzhongdai]